MFHHAYRFPSREAAAAALLAVPPSAEVDEIGRAFAPTTLGEDGELVAGEPLAGWYVNVIWRDAEPEEWEGARIAPAEAPRWWAGVPRTVLPVPPSAQRILTVLQFRDRLTEAEEIAITAAGMASPAVRVWLDRLAGAQEVNLDDPRTVAGLNSMAEAGLLAPGRVAEILA